MFAIIDNGTVVGLSETEEGIVHETVEAPEGVQVGWSYLDGEFLPPVTPVENRIVPKSLWLASLYTEEARQFARLDCVAAALTAADYAVTPQQNMLLYMHTLWAAFLVHWRALGTEIDLADQKVQEGLNLFGGLCIPPLSPARVQEILDWQG